MNLQAFEACGLQPRGLTSAQHPHTLLTRHPLRAPASGAPVPTKQEGRPGFPRRPSRAVIGDGSRGPSERVLPIQRSEAWRGLPLRGAGVARFHHCVRNGKTHSAQARIPLHDIDPQVFLSHPDRHPGLLDTPLPCRVAPLQVHASRMIFPRWPSAGGFPLGPLAFSGPRKHRRPPGTSRAAFADVSFDVAYAALVPILRVSEVRRDANAQTAGTATAMGKLLADFPRALGHETGQVGCRFRDAAPHGRQWRLGSELILGAIERHQFLSGYLVCRFDDSRK